MNDNDKILKNNLLDIVINSKSNDNQFKKSDELFLTSDLISLQLSTDDVLKKLFNEEILVFILKYIQEIEDEKINYGLKAHGQRHICNVLLYSALIGQEYLDNIEDLEILLVATKYHDISRKTDKFEKHAEESSVIASKILKDKYSQQTLSIIKTIIEFHEIPRNLKNGDEIFKYIALKNGVLEIDLAKARELSEILKDADALDRTRFINSARLNYKYLKFDFSKKLIKFAAMLQETYAILDLKNYDCDEEINQLLKYYTPQEILRIIRHNLKETTNENVEKFINDWLNYEFEDKKTKKI